MLLKCYSRVRRLDANHDTAEARVQSQHWPCGQNSTLTHIFLNFAFPRPYIPPIHSSPATPHTLILALQFWNLRRQQRRCWRRESSATWRGAKRAAPPELTTPLNDTVKIRTVTAFRAKFFKTFIVALLQETYIITDLTGDASLSWVCTLSALKPHNAKISDPDSRGVTKAKSC